MNLKETYLIAQNRHQDTFEDKCRASFEKIKRSLLEYDGIHSELYIELTAEINSDKDLLEKLAKVLNEQGINCRAKVREGSSHMHSYVPSTYLIMILFHQKTNNWSVA